MCLCVCACGCRTASWYFLCIAWSVWCFQCGNHSLVFAYDCKVSCVCTNSFAHFASRSDSFSPLFLTLSLLSPLSPVAAFFARYGRIPYAPSSADHIAAIFTLLDRQQRKQSEEQPEVIAARRTKDSCVFTDLGSGDGRVVIAAAQKGFWAQGVELNYW